MVSSVKNIEVSEQSSQHTGKDSVKPSQKVLANVTLICTLYNEEQTVGEFLDSLFRMSCLPAELIMVDGGSTDRTTTIISEFLNSLKPLVNARLIIDPLCNRQFTAGPIGKGRNVAINNASNEIIACTDCGCLLDRYWLERLTTPLVKNPDCMVVAGWYLPDARSFFERCVGTVFLLPADVVDATSVIPSSRSIAFRKAVWETVGGYPEEYYTAEDTWFVAKIRNAGFNITFASDAIVYWRMKSSLFSFVKLIYSYGFGDGFCTLSPMNLVKNFIKLGLALLLLVGGIWINSWFFLGLIIYLWLLPFYRRIKEAFKLKNIVSMPLLALIKIVADASYFVGHLRGRWVSLQKKVTP